MKAYRHLPRRAHVWREHELVTVAAEEVQPGKRLVVKAGDIVPAAGAVLQEGVDVLVILIARRAGRQIRRYLRTHHQWSAEKRMGSNSCSPEFSFL